MRSDKKHRIEKIHGGTVCGCDDIERLGGAPITQIEVESAIEGVNNNDTFGLNQIYGEVLKLLDSNQMKVLTALFNKI